jgi:hypothetical protein
MDVGFGQERSPRRLVIPREALIFCRPPLRGSGNFAALIGDDLRLLLAKMLLR